MAGLLLSETEFKHQVNADIRPFRGILLGLFFMTVGMSIDIALIWTELATISLIVIGLMVGKTIVTAALCRVFGMSAGISLRTGLLLSQGGEFGFVLFMAASALGLLALETTQILLASVTLTMVATPAMAYAGRALSSFLASRDSELTEGVEHIGEGMHDHVLIAGFGRVGQTVAKVLSASGIPYVALDMDTRRIVACRAKGMPVFFGDASQIETLNSAGAINARGAVVTIDLPEQADHIVAALRNAFPELPVIVRAKDLLHGRHLEEQGATRAVPEALEASLQLGASAMTSIGIGTDEVTGVIEEFRNDDYAVLGDTIRG